MACRYVTVDGVMGDDTFFNILAESTIQPYMYEPEYTEKELSEMEQRDERRSWSSDSSDHNEFGSKMFREMGCQTKVMTFDAECQTEPSENDLQWQTSSADSMQSHKKPSRRRKGSPSTLYDDCDWKSPVKMENQSDCQAEFGQHKRSKHVVNTQLKDHLRISHDKMMETTGGYGTTVCSEFDKECESLHGQLQVKVETEEVHIQDVHHAFMEIKPVKVKEEPDDCPSSSTSNIYGVIEQALPSPGHLKQEEEEPEAVTQYEDIVKVVVKQEDEKLILVKEEDKISEF
ncbi:uncharacterized protein LOC130110415 isoform X3 [Lampris incognitus]|uniref:uncharacterized protein LOC130110415 isoform X3 n=1 Tax=Lampris incognitus TaxID=2546036 RepID=UPI0024B554E7|nr:uncharacterized protein LOC130110415 isoform X3 [Lampris incognitus]